MLVIPLKVPHPCELQTQLASWVDRHTGSSSGPDFTAEECRDDLVRLASLRRAVTNALTHPNGYASVMEAIDDCHEYHAALLQCESRKLTGIDKDGVDSHMELEWDGAFAPPSSVHNTLMWERACMLWDMCAVETHSASNQKSSSIASVKASIGHWRMAASLMKNLREHVEEHNLHNVTVDFSRPMLLFWENIMIAQAQMATYEFSIVKTARPSHPALARLAAGTVPVLHECLKLSRDPLLTSHLPAQTQSWSTHCRALSIWFKGKAEYHESCASRSKSQWGMELARMKRALAIVTECQSYFQRLPSVPPSLVGFDTEVGQLLTTIRERIETAQTENEQEHHEAIPTNLPDLRGQLLVKADSAIPETMTTPSAPLFHRLRKRTERDLVQRFTKSMTELVEQMSALVHQQTEAARTELARVNLPHSLTAYKQEQSGGGIPQDLWERVEDIQRGSKMKQLKQDLWQLRDVADAARDLASQIRRQLDEDIEMDRLFREVFPYFEGHNVTNVQKEARSTLTEYETLLAKSQAGDAVLLKRLEVLDTDPKYQLLQYKKSKLDRLLPSASASSPKFDTKRLSEMLADLSQLFEEREATLGRLREKVQSATLKTTSSDESSQSSQQSHRQLREARNDAQAISYDIQLNVDRQADLLDSILAENEKFMQARRSVGVSNNASDSCIAMIDDAIEDVEFFSKHLKEGHNFYNVVTPKLEQLKHQVGDISVRLTVERCEHEEESRYGDHRRKQEMQDARMAATLSGGAGGSGGMHRSRTSPASSGEGRYANGPTRDVRRPAGSVPGAESVSHSEPQVRVDDEKVASLVAMDFDPDKVVDALKRYDNNIEQALNELLQS